jgi:hypothetical protein
MSSDGILSELKDLHSVGLRAAATRPLWPPRAEAGLLFSEGPGGCPQTRNAAKPSGPRFEWLERLLNKCGWIISVTGAGRGPVRGYRLCPNLFDPVPIREAAPGPVGGRGGGCRCSGPGCLWVPEIGGSRTASARALWLCRRFLDRPPSRPSGACLAASWLTFGAVARPGGWARVVAAAAAPAQPRREARAREVRLLRRVQQLPLPRSGGCSRGLSTT